MVKFLLNLSPRAGADSIYYLSGNHTEWQIFKIQVKGDYFKFDEDQDELQLFTTYQSEANQSNLFCRGAVSTAATPPGDIGSNSCPFYCG
jgi:hypothetical protein